MENRLSNTYYLKKKYVYAAMCSLELIGRKATLFMCKFFNGNADFCMYFQNIS